MREFKTSNPRHNCWCSLQREAELRQSGGLWGGWRCGSTHAGRFILLCFLCRKKVREDFHAANKAIRQQKRKNAWMFLLLVSVSSPPSLHSSLPPLSFLRRLPELYLFDSLVFPLRQSFSLSLPLLCSVHWLSLKWTNKGSGGKEVACKRIRGVSCGCALSHACTRGLSESVGMAGCYVAVWRWPPLQHHGHTHTYIYLHIVPHVHTDTPLSKQWRPGLSGHVCHPSGSNCYSHDKQTPSSGPSCLCIDGV